MSRHAAIVACADQLAEQLDAGQAAVHTIPRGLPAQQRADLLDLVTSAVAELRRSRPGLRARTVSGQAVDHPAVEQALVAWEGERPPFFDEDGGER
jgi:hypothetical protein